MRFTRVGLCSVVIGVGIIRVEDADREDCLQEKLHLLQRVSGSDGFGKSCDKIFLLNGHSFIPFAFAPRCSFCNVARRMRCLTHQPTSARREISSLNLFFALENITFSEDKKGIQAKEHCPWFWDMCGAKLFSRVLGQPNTWG